MNSRPTVYEFDEPQSVDGNTAAIDDVNTESTPSTDSAKPATVGPKTVSDDPSDPVELALADALIVATAKGDLQLMAAALAELRERRQERAGVVVLGGTRRGRDGGRS